MSSTAAEFKIAMLAPSRIGKTSLVAAVLQDTKELLAGTPLSIKPKNPKTGDRINQHVNELRGSLREREFDTGAVAGTEASFEFSLTLGGVSQTEHNLDLTLLDYPGQWLSALTVAEGTTPQQAQCAKFMRQASVLLLVVDASLIMEAGTSREKRAIDSILDIMSTESLIEEWLKSRCEASDEPAMLLVCPVKCETYFDDNGGSRDQSLELYRRILELYGEVFEKVKKDWPDDAEILYMPVDTIGCVEFSRASWDFNTRPPAYTPSYRVRGTGKQRVKGANDILLAIAKQLFRYQEMEQTEKAESAEKKADEAAQRAKDKGFWDTIGSIFGIETDDEKKAAKAKREAADAVASATSVAELVDALAARKFGPRVKVIYSSERR